MKKILTFFAFCISFISFAQTNSASNFINYQSVLRDSNGEPIAAGTPVTLNFKIFNDGTITAIAYEENHNLVIPPSFIINVKIGKGVAVAPNTNFSSIQWNGGEVSYIVSVNGTPIGSRAYFGSVPYAFNTGAGSTTYSPSLNVTTTGNVLDLTDKLTNSVTVGANQFNGSRVPIVSVDQKGRVISANDYAVNVMGDIAGRLDSQYVKKLGGTPLSNVMPVSGQVLQFNGTNWVPNTLVGSGPWNYSLNTIYPSNSVINDKVAIGSATATSLLDVKNSSLSPYVSSPAVSVTNLNPSFNTSGVVHISHQTGSGAALYVQNMNSAIASDGVIINMSNSANVSDGIRSTNVGLGRAGNFVSTSSTSTVETLLATANSNSASAIRGSNLSNTSNSLAIGIHGRTQNPHQNAAGVVGENVGGGFGVVGTTSANVAGVAGINLNTGNMVNAFGTYGLSNSTHTMSAGSFGESKGAGYGVYGINTSTLSTGYVGVYGTTTGTFVQNTGVLGEIGGAGVGVRGVNKGSGNAIQGTKPAGATSGSAGRFEINDAGNTSSALLAITQGPGAAVQAMAGSPVASNLSLLLMNGHIKAGGNIAISAATITHSVVGNFTVPLSPQCANCNDVRGEVTFYVQTTGLFTATDFVEVIVPFTKPYSAIPFVVVTPTNDQLGMHHRISFVSTSEFRIRIYRPSGQTFPTVIGAGSFFSFNYYVIE